jgi:hypothetical protein
MSNSSNTVDLLNPADFFRANYVHQLRQTIAAYSASMITLGEALQNAIDAVCQQPRPQVGMISVKVDFDEETVIVRDNGVGFPPDLPLLYLGGSLKKGQKTKGQIGVGIKVTMFSSEYFCVRSNTEEQAWKVEINDAYKFENLQSLPVPDPLPKDLDPLESRGTEVIYRFPKADEGESYLDHFVTEVLNTCLPRNMDSEFGKTVTTLPTGFPSPFSAMLASFLRRYSYVGDVLAALNRQHRYPDGRLQIEVIIRCSNPEEHFGHEAGTLFGDERTQAFLVEPSYLCVHDTLEWVPEGKKAPRIFEDKLGRGGTNLQRTDGFNVLLFNSPEDYESLLVNKRGQLPPNIDKYQKQLFPGINGILLTIGRIPEFERYLPGGSRRVISCNGVVTSHDIDLTRGRNQEYVRCFDLVIDLDAELNYGKTQLTNMHLVKWVRDYINEAYVRVIQNAAGAWVGRIPSSGDEDTEVFVGRENLGLPDYISRKVPRDENDVIGLFFEMAGRGLFPGYRVFGLSQKARYDGKAAILREVDDETVLEPTDDTKLRVIEFKLLVKEVIRDFERDQKDARDIDLVIAWDLGEYERGDYAIYDIDQSSAYQDSPKRVFPRVTKYIYDSRQGSEVQVLLLKEVVAELKAAEQAA